MPEDGGVIRFEPMGPAESGLVEWDPIDPGPLVSGEPVQRGHIYHEVPEAGYMTGVWDCTAFTDQMTPYAVDEFMYLLEGSIVMGLPDGSEVTINAGEAFAIPKGFECQWKQPGYVRKYFLILDGPVIASAANPSLTRITVPELSGTPGDGGPAAVERKRVDFLNSTGEMQVSLRSFDAGGTADAVAAANDLIVVLAGSLELREQGGASSSFGLGDAVYVRLGTRVTSSVAAGTRLLQASYAPG